MKRAARTATAILSAVLIPTVLVPAGPVGATPGPGDAPQYWFDTWSVFDLWHSGVRGQGVTIAEIDTGVNADLPELRGRVVPGTDLGRKGDGTIDREVNQFGHGTAMASIMVGRPGLLDITGLAPGAKVMPIAVPLNGTTDAERPDRLPDAITYAADHGAKVISMSLGGKRFAGSDTNACPDEEQAAVFHAMRKGAVVIASVGNTGPQRNTIEEPGVCLGVVSVGAVDSRGKIAAFSARQPYLSMVAPGVGIPSLGRVPGNAYAGDGTSQSTAIVSAAAALVWSKYPQASAREVVTRILATLDDKRNPHSDAYGYGLLNTNRAVTADVPATVTNPVYDSAAPFLKRDAAFAKDTAGHAPPPAAKSAGTPGDYTVGSNPRITSQVRWGIALAAAGLVALIALLVVALLRRRTRTASGPFLASPDAPSRPAWPDPQLPHPQLPHPQPPHPQPPHPRPPHPRPPHPPLTDPYARPRPRPAPDRPVIWRDIPSDDPRL